MELNIEYNKYLKYKNKYLSLKENQEELEGGSIEYIKEKMKFWTFEKLVDKAINSELIKSFIINRSNHSIIVKNIIKSIKEFKSIYNQIKAVDITKDSNKKKKKLESLKFKLFSHLFNSFKLFYVFYKVIINNGLSKSNSFIFELNFLEEYFKIIEEIITNLSFLPYKHIENNVGEPYSFTELSRKFSNLSTLLTIGRYDASNKIDWNILSSNYSEFKILVNFITNYAEIKAIFIANSTLGFNTFINENNEKINDKSSKITTRGTFDTHPCNYFLTTIITYLLVINDNDINVTIKKLLQFSKKTKAILKINLKIIIDISKFKPIVKFKKINNEKEFIKLSDINFKYILELLTDINSKCNNGEVQLCINNTMQEKYLQVIESCLTHEPDKLSSFFNTYKNFIEIRDTSFYFSGGSNHSKDEEIIEKLKLQLGNNCNISLETLINESITAFINICKYIFEIYNRYNYIITLFNALNKDCYKDFQTKATEFISLYNKYIVLLKNIITNIKNIKNSKITKLKDEIQPVSPLYNYNNNNLNNIEKEIKILLKYINEILNSTDFSYYGEDLPNFTGVIEFNPLFISIRKYADIHTTFMNAVVVANNAHQVATNNYNDTTDEVTKATASADHATASKILADAAHHAALAAQANALTDAQAAQTAQADALATLAAAQSTAPHAAHHDAQKAVNDANDDVNTANAHLIVTNDAAAAAATDAAAAAAADTAAAAAADAADAATAADAVTAAATTAAAEAIVAASAANTAKNEASAVLNASFVTQNQKILKKFFIKIQDTSSLNTFKESQEWTTIISNLSEKKIDLSSDITDYITSFKELNIESYLSKVVTIFDPFINQELLGLLKLDLKPTGKQCLYLKILFDEYVIMLNYDLNYYEPIYQHYESNLKIYEAALYKYYLEDKINKNRINNLSKDDQKDIVQYSSLQKFIKKNQSLNLKNLLDEQTKKLIKEDKLLSEDLKNELLNPNSVNLNNINKLKKDTENKKIGILSSLSSLLPKMSTSSYDLLF